MTFNYAEDRFEIQSMFDLMVSFKQIISDKILTNANYWLNLASNASMPYR